MKGYAERSCGVCGGRFTPLSPHQRYCGPDCRKEADKRNIIAYRRRKRIRERDCGQQKPRFCLICGKALYGRPPNVCCCSPACSHAWQRRRMRVLASQAYVSDTDWLNCQLEKALLELKILRQNMAKPQA